MIIVNYFSTIQTNLKLLIIETYGLELLNIAALPESEFYIKFLLFGVKTGSMKFI
jgi:hypothetical protein